MKIWIDATRDARGPRVFGMSLVERLLRGVLEAGVQPTAVVIEVDDAAAQAALEAELPPELSSSLPLAFHASGASFAQRLRAAVADGEPVIAASADCVVDARLLGHFAAAHGALVFEHGEGDAAGAILRLEAPPSVDADSLLALGRALVADAAATRLDPADFSGYLTMLRRDLPPYVLRVADERRSLARVERFLFWSNYKGSTDFMTRYVYPPFVWAMVRPLARWRVHPNWVTGVDIVATFAAVPFFAAGAWLPGLLLAYLMSVLDSVDGKLARLTYTSSKLGEILDHGLDIVHPPIWYLAWGWALGGGSSTSLAFEAALWMFGFYVADRIVTGVFKERTGVSIHGYTRFDERVRTFISRRNVNLPIFTLAVVIDWLWPGTQAKSFAFGGIVAWQAVCTLFHAQRLVQFWPNGKTGRPQTV